MTVGSVNGGDSDVGVGVCARAGTIVGTASDDACSALAAVPEVGSTTRTTITVAVGDEAGSRLLLSDGVACNSSLAGCTALPAPQATRTTASARSAKVGPNLQNATVISSPRSTIMPAELSRSSGDWQGRIAPARR